MGIQLIFKFLVIVSTIKRAKIKLKIFNICYIKKTKSKLWYKIIVTNFSIGMTLESFLGTSSDTKQVHSLNR